MSLNIPSTTVQPMDFFRELSQRDGWIYSGHNKHIEVTVSNPFFGGKTAFHVQERDKLHRLNPLRFFLAPVPPAAKFANAKNLAAMAEAYAKDIANEHECHIGRISRAFERLAHKLSRNASPDQAAKISNALENAVITLQNASVKEGIAYFERGQPGRFQVADRVARHVFYEQLSHSTWPRRLNHRFHIGQNGGEFTVHLTTNRWFFQKWFAWPEHAESWRDYFARPESPAVAKIANAENLGKMVRADSELIRSHGLDTDSMITTLERIKGKMTNHTNFVAKARIEKAMDGAIGELRKIGKLIEKDRSNSWSNWIFQWTVVPVASATSSALRTTAKFVWAAVTVPFTYLRYSK